MDSPDFPNWLREQPIPADVSMVAVYPWDDARRWEPSPRAWKALRQDEDSGHPLARIFIRVNDDDWADIT